MRRYTVTVDGTAFTIDVNETAGDRFEVSVGDRDVRGRVERKRTSPAPRSRPRCS